MSLSLLFPSRTVLLLSDEALYLYSNANKATRLVDVIPWGAEGFIDSVADTISRKCGKNPILILNDMVEQHYRKEKVVSTKGGMMDRSAMVQRKLNSTFANYNIRAALKLKEKQKATKGQLAADIYIFTAVPDTEQFAKTIKASQKSLASLSGFCLLPIESSSMVKTLAEKLSQSKKASKWSVFIGQHKNGGLRQVVTKDGELALTRMTPVIDSDREAEKWAGQVLQELQATMSYLSRFGYSSAEGIDLILISNPEPADIIKSKIDQADVNFYPVTASEAAKALNIPIGAQEDERYADVLHVAWVARKNKLGLPMKATEVDKVSRPRQASMVASAILTLTALFFAYQTYDGISSASKLSEEIDQYQRNKAQADLEYERELSKKNEMGFDLKLVQSSMEIVANLEDEQIDFIDLFGHIGQALGRDMHLDNISIERNEEAKNIGQQITQRFQQNDVATKEPLFETKLTLVYPSTTNIPSGNEEVNALAQRLQQLLSDDYEVSVTKLLKDYEYTEGLVVEAGRLKKDDLKQDFVAVISVLGPLKGKKND